jgi:localization factor PodJL
MSLSDWLNSTIGETPQGFGAPNVPTPSARPRHQARPEPRRDTRQEPRPEPRDEPRPAPRAALPQRDAADVAEIHQRLDAITRQIEQFSKPAPRSEPAVARQLNDAISRLDARLSQINEPYRPAPAYEPRPNPDMVERAANQVYSAAPVDPFSLDFAIAEIAARQGELDAAPRLAPRQAPPIAPSFVPPAAPQTFVPDMSGLERQLLQITTKIDALQRPDRNIEQSITAFRSELAEIRNVVTEAMPRRAIESIENEIRSLGRRIDESRQSGIDGDVLANLERALADIYKTLTTLTPAEQLAGFDDAIRNLGSKIDLIVRSSDDPGTLDQLQGAIGALRAITSNVASNEALGRLSDDLHTLSSKVDQLARADNSDSFAALEARIMTLTSALESRERPAAAVSSDHLETALQALSQRLDNMPVGNDQSSAFAHLEQRVSHLLERMESITDSRGNNLGRVEDGLHDILRHLERQQSMFASFNEPRSAAPSMDPALVDTIKRELSDMRFSQSETDRHTQDSLEVVHSTLGHVVDRLAKIEGDLRSATAAQAAKPAPVAPPIQQAPAARPAMNAAAMSAPPAVRPQMQNPVKAQAAPSHVEVRAPQAHFDAAPRDFAATAISHEAAPAFPLPSAISSILDPKPVARPASQHVAAPERASPRPMANLELPPDHPLEPGTRPNTRMASPSERIAASEDAISEIAIDAPEQANASSFIAAARRAAQAAAATGSDKTKSDKSKPAKLAPQLADGEKSASTIGSKIRSLLVGASVVVIVLGSFKMAMTLLDSGTPAPMAENVQMAPPLQLNAPAPTEVQTQPVVPAPSMTSPTPIGKQSMIAPPAVEPAPAPQAVPQAAPVPYMTPDVTGSIAAPTQQASAAAPVLPSSGIKITSATIPAGERLPEAIGGPALRAAALKGDATAAFEIGVRYAEGKGVPVNYEEAAKWYDRASLAGVVPGMFRLGTLYEKGLGVKKDAEIARRYYVLAADRGNAKAMHNLAVLDADGGTKGANYKSASLWFRKAADRGVADSQFNLGILYARGIGVEQNLAESFKWFSLAAAQGDVDSGRKRDDIAKRLDPQSLAAAKLAIQTFVPEGQPDDAINVAQPKGGWDGSPAQAAAKPATMGKRAAAK